MRLTVSDLQVGDTLINAYGECVNLIVEIDPVTCVYAWVCLFGPPHYVIGVVQRAEYKPDSPLHAIWDLYRGDRFYLNEVAKENGEEQLEMYVDASMPGGAQGQRGR